MVLMRVKGVKRVVSRGHVYYYHRASGRRLKMPFGSAAFAAEVAALDAKQEAKSAVKALPGTLGLLIDVYRRSPAWGILKPKTRLSYDRAFAALDGIRDMPLVELSGPFIAQMRDRLHGVRGRWMANYAVTVLGVALAFGAEQGFVEENHAAKVRKIRKATDAEHANRPWTERECRIVIGCAEPYMRVPIALAMYAGLRKSDALGATKAALIEGAIRVRTSKRGQWVTVPVHPELRAILDAAPFHDALQIAVNSYGKPWTESGFNASFRAIISHLEDVGVIDGGCTFHGLRHTAGTRLREAGAEPDMIRRILGQSSIEMAMHYSETADTTEQARILIAKMDPQGTRRELSHGKHARENGKHENAKRKS